MKTKKYPLTPMPYTATTSRVLITDLSDQKYIKFFKLDNGWEVFSNLQNPENQDCVKGLGGFCCLKNLFQNRDSNLDKSIARVRIQGNWRKLSNPQNPKTLSVCELHRGLCDCGENLRNGTFSLIDEVAGFQLNQRGLK